MDFICVFADHKATGAIIDEHFLVQTNARAALSPAPGINPQIFTLPEQLLYEMGQLYVINSGIDIVKPDSLSFNEITSTMLAFLRTSLSEDYRFRSAFTCTSYNFKTVSATLKAITSHNTNSPRLGLTVGCQPFFKGQNKEKGVVKTVTLGEKEYDLHTNHEIWQADPKDLLTCILEGIHNAKEKNREFIYMGDANITELPSDFMDGLSDVGYEAFINKSGVWNLSVTQNIEISSADIIIAPKGKCTPLFNAFDTDKFPYLSDASKTSWCALPLKEKALMQNIDAKQTGNFGLSLCDRVALNITEGFNKSSALKTHLTNVLEQFGIKLNELHVSKEIFLTQLQNLQNKMKRFADLAGENLPDIVGETLDRYTHATKSFTTFLDIQKLANIIACHALWTPHTPYKARKRASYRRIKQRTRAKSQHSKSSQFFPCRIK